MKYTQEGHVLTMNSDAKYPEFPETYHIFQGKKKLFIRISVKESPVYTEEEFKKKFPYYHN